jgi:hypothetical protein
MDERELLWRQYSQNVDLYKFYMELAIKFNAFYYAITGAIFSFYFANSAIPNIKYSLTLPLVMSVGFTAAFVYGAIIMRVLRDEVFAIRDSLKLIAAPDIGVLSIFLYIFSLVFSVVAIGCVYLLWCN